MLYQKKTQPHSVLCLSKNKPTLAPSTLYKDINPCFFKLNHSHWMSGPKQRPKTANYMKGAA